VSQATELAVPILVFASGDPLYHGVAASLLACTPAASITTVPWFTSTQLLCHRLRIPYAALHTVSLHGRGWEQLDAALLKGERLVGILTDAEHSPAAIANRMLAYRYSHYTLHVGEDLESEGERLTTLSPQEAAARDFRQPNCVLLVSESATPKQPGIEDSELELLRGRPDMVTKMPLRLTSLARLGLAGRRCLWDIGFCTGSISIEARRLNPSLQVVAFEKRPECASLLDRNARTFGAPGITAVMGDFLEKDIHALPRPDAVFIGGHGGKLEAIMTALDAVLSPGGRVVLNAVLPASRAAFEMTAAALQYHQLPSLTLRVDAHNPIDVLSAEKPVAPVSPAPS